MSYDIYILEQYIDIYILEQLAQISVVKLSGSNKANYILKLVEVLLV